MTKELFEIAANISTPLALSGLFAAILFLILRQIVAANLFPKLNRAVGGDILKMIIERLFLLALVAMILGFAGFIFTKAGDAPSKPPNAISVRLPSTVKLKDAVNFIAQLDNFTVDFTDGCSGVPWDAEIEGGPIMAKDTVELIELLRLRVKGAGPTPKYRVTKKQEKGTYEIVCN
jgi:hypothetical protein